MTRRKESASQTGLPFARAPSRDRTLEVHCDNCKAPFVAWYGEEDVDTETVDVEKCGLCGGDSFMLDNFKDCTLRLMAAGHGSKHQARLSRGLGLAGFSNFQAFSPTFAN